MTNTGSISTAALYFKENKIKYHQVLGSLFHNIQALLGNIIVASTWVGGKEREKKESDLE
jgi:hypothetical protein